MPDKQNDVITVSEDEKNEMLDSIKLNTEKESPKRKNEVKSEIVEQDISEEKPITEDEIKTQELYDEFRSFLKTSTNLEEDVKVKSVIPTGIDLIDAVLGGGFAVGALNIIVGQPGSGKSMLAIQTLGQGQMKHKGQMLGGFLDSEEATTSIRLSNLGVRYPKMKPYTDITVEKVFKFIEGLCVFKDEKKIVDIPSVVIWDSIANTLSQKERETDDPNSVIGYKARLLSILVPKYIAKLAQYNVCCLAVNQLRDVLQMGQFQSPKDLKLLSGSKDMPGGNVLKFNAFQLVEVKIKSVITPESQTNKADNYGFEGIIVKLKCVKNKLFRPNVEVEAVGSFTSGFSNFWTNYNFLKNNKRLNAGAWNYLVSLPDVKFRTKDAPKLYKENQQFKDAFDKEITETIQTEIIDKYQDEDD